MSIKKRLETARNEKDVENIYREELNTHTEGAQITSPYGIDGLLEAKNIRSLLEFKYDEQLKNKLCQCGLLIQCLYYLNRDNTPFNLFGSGIYANVFLSDYNY